ncbi:Hypothetical protein, putative [Bodo saltans]|uniref:Membrane-associated protein n=1 Tax=Bodo saltans TaxID=75058 RepID=A0A0S4J6V6_BODSA|nr:Hypothetical protein, putative [Bodo saltans]|eukprot:CUG71719.1 Hypothetical protein, putative [Bodo saltans]
MLFLSLLSCSVYFPLLRCDDYVCSIWHCKRRHKVYTKRQRPSVWAVSSPHSNAVSDGSTESQYYPSTTGGIVFRAASVSTVFQYQTYSTTVGPTVGAAVQHMHALDSVGGYYHRTISGPGAALDALWSDVLPGGIPIVPTAGLVFTVDNSYLYPYDTTPVISTQTIVLWNSVSSLMLFRIKSITYPTGIINYGGYLPRTRSLALRSRRPLRPTTRVWTASVSFLSSQR